METNFTDQDMIDDLPAAPLPATTNQLSKWRMSPRWLAGAAVVGFGTMSLTMSDSNLAATAPSRVDQSALLDAVLNPADPHYRMRIYEAIERLFLSHNRPRDTQIARRLTALYRDALAEHDELRSQSAGQFARFFLENKSLSLPKITLSQTSNLRARWIATGTDYFGIEFLGDDRVKLIMSAVRPGDPGLVGGLEHIDNVIQTVRAFGVTAA